MAKGDRALGLPDESTHAAAQRAPNTATLCASCTAVRGAVGGWAAQRCLVGGRDRVLCASCPTEKAAR